MKKINDWVIKTFGLRGSWSWAKKQMLNGAIIKRKATTGTYKIAIDNDKNRLLVATWGHLDQNPVWERCPHSLLDEDAVDYFVTAHKELSYGGIKIRMKDEFNYRVVVNTNDYITSYPASLFDMSIKEGEDIAKDHFDNIITIELYR